MTINTELILTVASWIGATTAIFIFVRKLITPVTNINEVITLMQRERLESAHAIYVNCLGWCPSGEKTVLSDIYRHYIGAGHNHIAKEYIDDICSLPDHPPQRGNGREVKFPLK